MELINKDALVAEIKKAIKNIYAGREYVGIPYDEECMVRGFQKAEDIINTLEVIDPYEQWIQHSSIEEGIKAHAEEYSFNIESELFNQLTKEQQLLWRKEIEQACISGGYNGLDLAKDPRYKENLEVKEVDLEKELSYEDYRGFFEKYPNLSLNDWGFDETWMFAQYCYKLGLKTQKGE